MTQQICAGEAYFDQPDELPLYAGQEGLLLHWQMDPQGHAYNLPFPLVVNGEIEMARLHLAVSEVGRRYPYLRARIRVGAEGPRLTWADAPPIPVIERRVEEPLGVAIRKAASAPFDLQSGPLMRVDLLRGSTETVLLLIVHHIVFDGVSGPILLSALSRAYAGESLGQPEEDLARIAGFVERQRALCEGPEGKARRAFWQGYLGNDVPAITLPASVDGRDLGGHMRIVPLDPALSKRVDQCARELSKSRFSLFFGAFYALMHGYTGQEDILVSTPFHGRRDKAIQDCIGNFANVLPIRRRLRGTDDYAAVVQGLSVDLRACIRHGDFPFPSILQAAGFVGEAGRSRIQRAMFVLQKFDTWKDGRNQDVSVQSIPFRGGRRDCTLRLIDVVQEIDYALNVFMREDSGGISFAWKDATGDIGPTRLDEMAHRYIEVIEDMVANPRRPLADGRHFSSQMFAGSVTRSTVPRQACGAVDEVAPERRLLALWKEYDAEPHTPERLMAVGREMLAWLRPPASDEDAFSGSEPSADRDRMALDLASTAGRLRGELPPLELPVRRPRPAVLAHEAQRADFELPVSLDLAGFAQREGASIEQVLLAGFLALLWRYSGQDVLVLGTQDRRLGEADAQSSDLLTPLVLRFQAGPEQRFRELLCSAAGELTEARRHPMARLDDVMRLLNPPRDTSRPAPFGVLFRFIDDPGEARGCDGLGAELDVSRVKYDLALSLHRRRDGIQGQLVYNGLLFDAPQMALLAEHFVRLLVQAVGEPETALGDFELLTAGERRMQIEEWNQTGAAFSDTSLPALLREQVRVRPQATALSDGARRVSYGELLERAERLARGLVVRGVRPGDFVALILRRGIAQVEAILGVLAAGAVYLAIDPEAPEDRIAFILSDTKARRVIVAGDERLRPALGGLSIETLVLDALTEPGGAAESVALPEIDAAAPAYCLYTSGTSGKPKGVVVTHQNVVRLVRNERFPYDFGPDDVWPLFHSYFFDVSVWEIFCCFAYGGRLVIVHDSVARDGQRFWQLLQRERVTVLNQTPSAFGHLLRVEELDPAPLEHLRYVIFAGEKLQPRMLTDWFARRPWVKYINMYGITETTVHSTVRFVTREDVAGDISNVGVPLPTTTLYLLDSHRRKHLLPVGVVGEIHVGGLGVTMGYFNRPELNAERFVPDPFTGGRMFRSGDLARYRADGTLEVIGRRDFQVKLRGYRIELGEIESCLREHAAVAEAVVLLEGGTEGKLVAILRLRATAPTAVELRAHLAHTLPEYMIPADFRAVERMPLTSNGKVDRRALASLGTPLPGRRSAPLETPTEQTLAAIWCELLGVDDIGADDSFFERGGHSLLGMRLLVCVADRFGVELPLRSVFEFSRLRELADVIDQRQEQRHAQSSPKSGLRRLHAGGERPPSSFQERVWLAERLDPGTSLYHVPLGWRIEGHLEEDVLSRALALLVERHEILRTRFVEQGGRLRPQVGAPWTPEVEQVDLQNFPASERETELHAWMHRAAHRPFDCSSGRLLRSALLRLDGRRQVLFFCLHHLVWDGASAPVFLRELERCYAVANSTGEVTLPAPSVQYRDFVDAQLRERASEAGAAGVAYWVEQLKGAPAFLAFPPSRRREPDGAMPISLPQEALARLRQLSEAQGASLFMVLATALAVVLHRCTDQEDVVFGCPVANREGGNFSAILGPCVNTVALRSLTEADTTLGDLLRAMKQSVLGALEHQDAPFEDVVTQLNPPRRSDVSPYIDVMLTLEVVPSVRPSVGGLELAPIAFDYGGTEYGTKFGLTVAFVESEGVLACSLLYKGDRFGAEDVRQMARLLERVQERFTDWIDVPLVSLPLDDDAERARLIRFERGEEPGAVATVPGLFARRCAERPDCPAVASSRGVRSYAALDARADALALRLEPLVAREEPVVALLLPRGEDLIVAMLAAWKAGCSFCPIDPGYPLARIEFILDDLRACAVLTDDEALRARFVERSAPVVAVADVAEIGRAHV